MVDFEAESHFCIGMTPDHAVSSSNTILRVCSEDLGISAGFEGRLDLRFDAVTLDHEGRLIETDTSSSNNVILVDFPVPQVCADISELLYAEPILCVSNR